MFNISPAARITFGIVGLTLSLLLVADFFGITPDGERDAIKQRQHFAEMVSVQISVAVKQKNVAAMQSLLWSIVQRNDQLLSAAVRRQDGVLLARFGEHERLWEVAADNSPTRMQLPAMDGSKVFGQIELMFKPVGKEGPFGLAIAGTLYGLIGFIVLFGSIAYWIFLRRSLMYLDPSAVVPARVHSALNVLTNGVLILDEKERIVLVNDSLADKIGKHSDVLMGKRPSSMHWGVPKEHGDSFMFPWAETQLTGVDKTGVLLSLETRVGKSVFLVNSSPIIDDDGKQRGVIVGFDDVTDLEAKNRLLHDMLDELEKSKVQVENQNKKLHVLATRDALTNCHNRRSLYDSFEKALEYAKKSSQPLSCIMTDIDHFKLVNDTHGHAAGDIIIKMVASVLTDVVREEDIVSRYGGEEFCIMLLGINVFEAEKIAERCRAKIAGQVSDGIKVTSSFGVSSLCFGAEDVDQLINQADEALYLSKDRGRDCVSSWEERRTMAS